jgi:hypothetical protein
MASESLQQIIIESVGKLGGFPLCEIWQSPVTVIRSLLPNLSIFRTDTWISGTVSLPLFVIGVFNLKKGERPFADTI